MRQRLFSLAVGAALLQTLVTLPARADSINFADYEGTPVYLTVSPYPSPQEISTQTAQTGPDKGDQFYVGLTQGIITVGGAVDSSTGLVEGGTASSMFYMYCVDFNDAITVPTSYLVNVQSLMAGSFTSDPILGESLATLQLQMTLGAGFGFTPSGNASADSDIQEDIWNLSSAGAFAPAINNMSSDLTNAEAAAVGGDFSNAFLLDTTDEPGQQAFMPVDTTFTSTTDVPPATPEPATSGLMVLALAGLGVAARRKKAAGRA
jgi:PEP-CTERM motif